MVRSTGVQKNLTKKLQLIILNHKLRILENFFSRNREVKNVQWIIQIYKYLQNQKKIIYENLKIKYKQVRYSQYSQYLQNKLH